MKNSPYKLALIFLLTFAYPEHSTAQDNLDYDFKYKVSKVLPAISISRAESKEAVSLIDLNSYYKASWIRSYHSVEISANIQGNTKKEISKNDILSQTQKELIALADVGTNIAVKVKYLPENTLAHNERKEMNFTFTIDPEMEATYAGGSEQLDQYLIQKGIDKISNTSIKQYNLAAVKFAVNEEGKVVDTEIVETSNDEKVDQLLVETICNMPDWTPAAYADGTKVIQEFVLTIGDHTSCVVNLLNIRRFDAE